MDSRALDSHTVKGWHTLSRMGLQEEEEQSMMPRALIPVTHVVDCNTRCNTRKNDHSGSVSVFMVHPIRSLVKCLKE